MRRRRGGRVAAIFGVAIGVAAVVFLGFVVASLNGADAEERAAKAAGIPTSYADFAPPPTISAKDNAAADFAAAAAAFVSVSPLYYPDVQIKAKRVRHAHADFAVNGPAIAHLLAAGTKPHLALEPVRPGDPAVNRMLDAVRRVEGVVAAEARADSDAGAPLEGLRLVRHIAHVGALTSEYPTWVGLIRGDSAAVVAISALQSILAEHGREPGIPGAAKPVLDGVELRSDLIPVLERDNLEVMGYLGSRESALEITGHDARTEAASYVPGMLARWRRRRWRTIRLDVAELRAHGGDWARLDPDLTAIADRAVEGTDGMIESLVAGMVPDACSMMPRIISAHRITQQAIAVFEAWNRTGHIPSSLPLGGEMAIDPRTNGRFGYIVGRGSFQIDGVGVHGMDPPTQHHSILHFRYPPPADY